MPRKDKARGVEGNRDRGQAENRSTTSGRFVKRQDRGEVRESVKESIKRSAKKNSAVWEKLSKY